MYCMYTSSQNKYFTVNSILWYSIVTLLFSFTLLKAEPLLPQLPEMPPALGPIEHFFKETEGKLVALDKTRFVPYEAETIKDKSFLLVYYSASWCPPCKAFTPELIQFYTKMKKDYADLFELILIPLDRKEIDMLNYMKAFKMPWPALAYKERNSISYLKAYQTPAIPGLILLHKNGFIAVDRFEYKGGKASPLSNEAVFSKIEGFFKQEASK